jgi:hypothetical protein
MSRQQERSFRALSFGFRFRSELPGAIDAVDRLLAPFSAPADGDASSLIEIAREDSGFVVVVDGAVSQRTTTLRSAVGWIAWKASLDAIETTDDFIVLHAGAVARGDAGIVLPAAPDSGKTTLTAALVQAGLDYLSDEAALVDPATGLVHPFPRALAMEPATSRLLGVVNGNGARDPAAIDHVTVDDLGGTIAVGPVPVRAVVFPTYRPGADVTIEPIGRAETVIALSEHSFNASRFGAVAVRCLAAVVADASCWRLTMGDLNDAASRVRDLVDAAPRRHAERASSLP